MGVACGSCHTLVVTAPGTVYAFGLNATGQLGDGSSHQKPCPTPSPVRLPSGMPISWIACGEEFSSAITRDGKLFMWGLGAYGQRGLRLLCTSLELAKHLHHVSRVELPNHRLGPAGARELNQLRSELQQEHRELMAAMQQQNANMAILQKRAEMAERHSAEARVELAEMRENLADQAFVSSLPPVVSNGDPMTAHGVELPIYMSKTTDAITGPPHVAPDEDYGVFIRDAAGPHHGDNDLGPALDAGAPFVALGSSANDLAGQLGKEMGVGAPGAENPSAKLLVRRGGLDVDDDLGSIVGDSAFIFPGQTMERAPFLKGSGQSVFSGPGAERPAPEVGPKIPGGGGSASLGEDPRDGGVGLAERFGGPEKPLGGDAYGDGPEAAGVSTRDADASRKLDAVYQKNAARMRALGVAPEEGFGGDDAHGSDPDQLEGLLRNFLKANAGESGGVSAFDAGAPPSVEAGAHDDPALGLNVEGAEDEDFGLGRPNTQMSMQAETRFVGSQY